MRRRTEAPNEPPDELVGMPTVAQLRSSWARPEDGRDPEIKAFYRWIEARREWAETHGARVRSVWGSGGES